MEKSGKKLKVAVVGLGKMGLLHASLLSAMPNVQLAALCEKSWLIRRLAKSTLKKVLVADKLDGLASLSLDAVYVTTPIPSHYSIVKQIYARGIAPNVFVEKTLSSNYAQSEDLCRMANHSKGCTMVGYMKRFSVTFRKAKELLDQGTIGSLLSFDAYAYSSDFYTNQNKSVTVARGGVLEDLGSHVSDIALWLFGDLLSIVKVSSSTNPKSDSVQFKVVGSNEFGGNFQVSWAKEGYRMPEFGLEINGTKGTVKVNDDLISVTLINGETKNMYRQDLDDHVAFLLGESEYYREDDHFIKSIVANAKAEPNFLTASKVDYLLENIGSKAQ